MTPDTDALRALADEAAAFRRLTPEWHRFRPEAGSVLVDPDTVRALCDAADEVERLRDEVARWESGRRVKVLPVLPEHPDALNLAADLLRKQTGEYYDTDAAMRAAAIALRDVDQIARQSRTAHAALVGELRALCDEWEAGPWSWLKDTAAPRIRVLLDRYAPEEGS